MQSLLFMLKMFYLAMTLFAIVLWAYAGEDTAEKMLWLVLVFSVGVVAGAQIGV